MTAVRSEVELVRLQDALALYRSAGDCGRTVIAMLALLGERSTLDQTQQLLASAKLIADAALALANAGKVVDPHG